MVRFTAPQSVVCSANLDDSSTLKEIGLTHIGTDKRERYILEGDVKGFISIIDTCIHMAADHGAEDAAGGMYYTNSAAVWAKREAEKLIAAGVAKPSAWGGIKPV